MFSNSRLGCFEKCPRQFRYRYVDKLPAGEQSIEAFVGKRVHDVIERLHGFVGRGRVPSLAAVLQRFRTLWQETYDADTVHIARQGTAAEDYHALGEACLSNFYRGHYPFDADKTVAIEERVTCSLDERGRYRIQGIIDRLVRTRDGQLEIHDYKTGARIPSQRQLDEDRQLALYEMGVRERYDEAGEIRLVWHFLRHGQTRSSRRSAEQLTALREHTMRLIDRIHAESEYRPRPSPLCAWCEYSHLCPASTAPRESPSWMADTPSPDAPSPALPPRGQLSLL